MLVSQVVEEQVFGLLQSLVFKLLLQSLVSELQVQVILTYKVLVILQEDFI